MALKAGDLAALGNTPITIRSGAFHNVHLRLDGRTVTSFTSSGGGTVNCQYGPTSSSERFRVRPQVDGSIALESVAFPNVYLRMDGSAVTAYTSSGGGTVNCQYGGAGPYEKFRVVNRDYDLVSLQSVAFPNVYLRMDGYLVNVYSSAGSGTVNCQYTGDGPNEMFVLDAVDEQRLDFAMQYQEQTYWCWSATAVSVAAFFNPATTWTQCSMVNAEFGLNTCCGPAASDTGSCNKPWYTDKALSRVGHYRDWLAGALSLNQIRVELQAPSPIGVRVQWRGGGGHAVVVRGCYNSGGVDYVSVADPWYGTSEVPYDTFRNNYQGSGLWDATYRTKR
ncbi:MULTISPECIES: papain-like cysteine protease family protein [Streptosporangium]|uniref:Peptidase C39-like domain-containing protein n=1 Tax=Streptosporangium brasiliense TaxID=47480 RepID=A0ABT9RBM2_9ACTN|nr:papain-like cysteine protease family protein [Streptosporangium brasiliense]MDP9865780.1 hypothetical protein [Streptosporangium brasiliense]